MILIVLCHIAAQAGTSLGTAAGQFLNVGVELFFFISGYLFGQKQIKTGYGKWLCRRILRILPSYYLFLLMLGIVHLVLGIHQGAESWLISVLMLQGVERYLIGAEHLWFLTVMMVCYLVTPLLDHLNRRKNLRNLLVLLGCSALFQVLVTGFHSVQLGRYWHLLNFYILAYILGTGNFFCSGFRNLMIGGCCGALAIVIRLLGRHYLDGTVLYNIYIVGLTHAVLAISIVMAVQYFFRRAPGKAVAYFDQISYEVYLVHYMLIAGPLSMMKLTDSFLLNGVLACLAALALAAVLHAASHYVTEKIRR